MNQHSENRYLVIRTVNIYTSVTSKTVVRFQPGDHNSVHGKGLYTDTQALHVYLCNNDPGTEYSVQFTDRQPLVVPELDGVVENLELRADGECVNLDDERAEQAAHDAKMGYTL